MKIVSACLVGIKCRRDGDLRPCPRVIDLIKHGKAIPICPEQLGGLTTPRLPAEQKGDKVLRKNKKDVTAEFRRGAEIGLKLAQMVNCKEAILKSKSPSCGSGEIPDGTFSGKLIKGDGVFAALLKKHKIKVLTEKEIK